MNPRARLRTRPRASSESVASAAPSTSMSPAVGASRPPSRCKSVLLPDPEAPTTATVSPGTTERSTPISTGTSSGPLRYVFRKPRHSITGRAKAASLIAERLRRIHLRRAPGRVNRRQQGKDERNDGDGDHVAGLQIGRQLVDVVDGLVEDLDAEQPLDCRQDRTDIECEQHASAHAEKRPDHADQSALAHED